MICVKENCWTGKGARVKVESRQNKYVQNQRNNVAATSLSHNLQDHYYRVHISSYTSLLIFRKREDMSTGKCIWNCEKKKLFKNKIMSHHSCQFLLLSKTNSISRLCQLLPTPLSSLSKPTSIFHSLPVLGCDQQLEMIVEQDAGTCKFCLSQRRTVICPCCRSKKNPPKTNQTKWVLLPCAAGLSFYQYSWASCLKCFWKWSVLHKHTWWTLLSFHELEFKQTRVRLEIPLAVRCLSACGLRLFRMS